jgi:hypothetical protein
MRKRGEPNRRAAAADVLSAGFAALKAEAVENGSARLTVFYTDGRPTGFTTGHSRGRKTAGGAYGKK